MLKVVMEQESITNTNDGLYLLDDKKIINRANTFINNGYSELIKQYPKIKNLKYFVLKQKYKNNYVISYDIIKGLCVSNNKNDALIFTKSSLNDMLERLLHFKDKIVIEQINIS